MKAKPKPDVPIDKFSDYITYIDDVKMYACKFPKCDKTFLDGGSLRKHMITHGERQYICPVSGCCKKFLDNSKLKRHMLVHTVNALPG